MLKVYKPVIGATHRKTTSSAPLLPQSDVTSLPAPTVDPLNSCEPGPDPRSTSIEISCAILLVGSMSA